MKRGGGADPAGNGFPGGGFRAGNRVATVAGSVGASSAAACGSSPDDTVAVGNLSVVPDRIGRGHDFGGLCPQAEQRDSPAIEGRRPQCVQVALAASLA